MPLIHRKGSIRALGLHFTDWESSVFSPGCCLFHRPILLRSDNAAALSSLSSHHPHRFPSPTPPARSTAWSLILFSLCRSAPSVVWHSVPCCPPSCFTAGCKTQSLSSFLSHSAGARQPRLLSASPSFIHCVSVLSCCPSSLSLSFLTPALHFPLSSHWVSSVTCSLLACAFALSHFLFAHSAAAPPPPTLLYRFLFFPSSLSLSLHLSCSYAFWTKVL